MQRRSYLKTTFSIIFVFVLSSEVFAGGYGEPRNTSILEFSPDQERIAFARPERDSLLYIFTLDNAEVEQSFKVEGIINDIEAGTDGRYMAIGTYISTEPTAGRIIIFDIVTGKEINRLDTPAIYWIEFLPQKDLIAYPYFDEVHHWSFETGEDQKTEDGWEQYRFSVHLRSVSEIAVPGGGIAVLLNSEESEKIKLRNIDTEEIIYELDHDAPVRSIFVHKNGSLLGTIMGPPHNSVQMWDIEERVVTNTFFFETEIFAGAFGQDNNLIALHAGSDQGKREKLIIFDASSEKTVRTIELPRK